MHGFGGRNATTRAVPSPCPGQPMWLKVRLTIGGTVLSGFGKTKTLEAGCDKAQTAVKGGYEIGLPVRRTPTRLGNLARPWGPVRNLIFVGLKRLSL